MTVIVLVLAILLSKVGIIDLISKGYNAMSYALMIVYMLPMLTIGLYTIVKGKK